MRKAPLFLAATFAVSAVAGAMAQGAAKPTLVATFNDWSIWKYDGDYYGNGAVSLCFLYAEPQQMQPKKLDHGRVSFAVTMNSTQGIENEANFIAGYPMKDESSVTVEIGDRKFTMFAQGDSAWLVDKKDEPGLLEAMKNGKVMTVKATSRRGNDTSYDYSLRGVTAAAEKMLAECK
jgi:hypothetical protein